MHFNTFLFVLALLLLEVASIPIQDSAEAAAGFDVILPEDAHLHPELYPDYNFIDTDTASTDDATAQGARAICQTSNGSPSAHDVDRALQNLAARGRQHCCTSKTNCSQIMQHGNARLGMCPINGNQGSCVTCDFAAKNLYKVYHQCQDRGRVGGVWRDGIQWGSHFADTLAYNIYRG